MPEADLLIAGAGPAGLAAALAAAESGVKAVLLERKREVGRHVQCAEFVPALLAREFPIPDEVVARRITWLDTDVEGRITRMRSPGYLIHRDRWESSLACRLKEMGQEIYLSTAIERAEGATLVARQGTGTILFSGKILIGADGPWSLVRLSLGLPRPHCVLGLQRTYPLPRHLRQTDSARVFFRSYLPGGYGWYFPKESTVNVGVGVERKFCRSLREALERLVAELHAQDWLDAECWFSQTGGLIPAGPVARTRHGPVLLVGDAGPGYGIRLACGHLREHRGPLGGSGDTTGKLRIAGKL